MKKLFLTNLSISLLFIILLMIPWNVNFAKPDCVGKINQTFCKNLLIITPCHPAENSPQEIFSTVFPFDDLIIKI